MTRQAAARTPLPWGEARLRQQWIARNWPVRWEGLGRRRKQARLSDHLHW